MKVTCTGASSLAEKASLFEDYIERVFVDPDGLLYSVIYDKTQKPYTKEDFKPHDNLYIIPTPQSRRHQPWDIFKYEDTGMATGTYLAAQSFRYQATQDPRAGQRAARTFEGLRHVYGIGSQKEEGYFPKPYGGGYSEETSTDQYLYAMKGMMAYLSVAPADHARLIRHMIPKMVDYWVNRNYQRTYFNAENMQWTLQRFPSFLLMAHNVSGARKYLDEFTRLNEEKKVYLQPGEGQIFIRLENPDKYPFMEYEKQQGNKYFLLYSGQCAAMDLLQLDECLHYSDAYKTHWLRSMKKMWNEGKLGLTSNGLSRQCALYDPATGEVSAPPPGYKKFPPEPMWSYADWMGHILNVDSLMLARAGVLVARWLPEEKAEETVIKVLAEIDPKNIRVCIDPDGGQLLYKDHYMCHMIPGVQHPSWLCAYWQGRAEGLISPKA